MRPAPARAGSIPFTKSLFRDGKGFNEAGPREGRKPQIRTTGGGTIWRFNEAGPREGRKLLRVFDYLDRAMQLQ